MSLAASNLSTGKKLALSFGLMAALIAIVGYVGIRGMAGMSDELTELYEKEALGVRHIKEANINVIATQSAVRAALLDDQAGKWLTEVRKREMDFHIEFEKYRGTLSRAEDLAKAKEAATLFQELREVQDTVLGLVKNGSSAQARGMWANLDPLLDAVGAALEELSQRKVAAMEKAYIDTLKDPQFIEDAGKQKFEIFLTTGPDVRASIEEMMKLKPETIAKVRQAMGI